MPKKNNQCPWCQAVIPGNHIPGCPSNDLQKMPRDEYKNLIISEQETGYRLKSPSGNYYNPLATFGRTDSLGKLYSHRGLISLLAYSFTFFHQDSENWEVLEYLVEDEINLINRTILVLWEPWQKILERRKER